MPHLAGAAALAASAADSVRTPRRTGSIGVPLALVAALGSAVLTAPFATADPATGTQPASQRADRTSTTGTITSRTAAAPVRPLAAGVPTYTVRAGDTVSHIAMRTGVSQAAIIAANGLDRRGFIRAGQVLSLPGVGGTVAQPSAAASAPASAATSRYTVRAGDTVSHIAMRTGVSQAAIIAANGLDRRGFIRAGQVLSLPGAGGAAAASAAPAAAAPASAPTSRYTVRSGDTVSAIAARTGVSQAAIIAANGLDRRGFIRAGEVLSLPGSAAPSVTTVAAVTPAATGSYTVRSGDSLSAIAARSSTTVAALRTANPGLDARGTIRVGQTLRVPQASAPMSNTFAGRTYPAATVSAATINRDVLASRSVPSREQMREIIASTARHYGVDPALAQAIAFQESGFNQRAVSPANAVGAMQVIPSSGRWASDMAGRTLDLLDPRDNATAGVLILRANGRAADDLATGIAAYYQGLSSVRKNGMYPDTRRYVVNVQTLMNRFR